MRVTGDTTRDCIPHHWVPDASRALALQLSGAPAAVSGEKFEILRRNIPGFHQLAGAVVPADEDTR